ncbi:MAG TPA: MFS transporter [Gaiellaceae bacterium]|nr:MFS transporter [Gaiellaceae bacterium]
MILGVLCLVGFAFAWLLGADLRRLAAVRLAWSWTVPVALALQLLVYAAGMQVPGGDGAVHLVSYGLLIAFGLRNLRVPGFALAAAGLGSNALAIFLNGGHMPVSLAAWTESGRPAAELVGDGISNNTGLITSATRLHFLGDVFALPAWLPLANTFSVGDVLLVCGATLFVVRQGRRESDAPCSRVLDPLRVRGFRTLLVGRTASKLGDWMALAALVTWMYQRTHSTLAVSLVLLARLAASVAGGVAASVVLDRCDRFATLRTVEAARGLTALAGLGLVAAGRPYLVAACVFVSYLLAAATDPTASSLVADLLAPEQRHAGNALHALARASVMAIGSVAGGLVATGVGVLPALAADAVTFALAAMLYAAAGRAPVPARGETDEPARDRAEVLAFIGRSPGLRALVLSFAVANVATGLLNASLPAFLSARAPHVGGYGVAVGAIAVGLMCGELLSGRAGEAVAARTPALAFAICAGVLAVAGTSTLATSILTLLFLLGAADGATETAYDTLVQRQTPGSLRAGVFALGGSLQQLAMGVGFLVAAMLGRAGASLALEASAAAFGAAALVGVAVAAAGRAPLPRRSAAMPPV